MIFVEGKNSLNEKQRRNCKVNSFNKSCYPKVEDWDIFDLNMILLWILFSIILAVVMVLYAIFFVFQLVWKRKEFQSFVDEDENNIFVTVN